MGGVKTTGSANQTLKHIVYHLGMGGVKTTARIDSYSEALVYHLGMGGVKTTGTTKLIASG